MRCAYCNKLNPMDIYVRGDGEIFVCNQLCFEELDYERRSKLSRPAIEEEGGGGCGMGSESALPYLQKDWPQGQLWDDDTR